MSADLTECSGVRYLSSVLECMRAIIAAAYENAVYKKYTHLREAELREQKKFRSRFAINSWTVLTLTGEFLDQCDAFTE